MNARYEHSAIVTVLGGSGFVGRYVVRALANDGWRVRAAVRRPDLAGYLQPMGKVGQVHAVQANIRYADSVRRAVEGAEVVVNLVGVLFNSRPQTFQQVHVAGARAAAKAAKEAGAKRFIHVSAIGADRNAPGLYGRTKASGEAAVLCEFPEAVIMRPSLMFGPEDQLFNRFAGMASMSPVLPLVGGGKLPIQPVYVGDVGAAITAAVRGEAKPRGIYELGGPEVITFRRLMELTMEWSGRRRWLLPMPFWMAKAAALLTVPLPNALRPITVDQVRMLSRPNVVSEAAVKEARTLQGLGIHHPHTMESIVPAYLERYRRLGQFARYRG